MRAFITGSRGSIGEALTAALVGRGHTVMGWDIVDGCDVADLDRLGFEMRGFRPDVVFHLAGAKHAGSGESDPLETTLINVIGTANVLAAAPGNARVVTASTCKAADPETAYGSTKLIAERLTLNAGHSVARFYNVRESSGNVFEIWDAIPPGEPVPVADCWRYFISIAQAVDLLLAAATLPPGRYTVNPGESRSMREIAFEMGRAPRLIKPRRGDRYAEPRKAASEWLEPVGGGIERIYSIHDARGAYEDVGHPGADALRADPDVRRAA